MQELPKILDAIQQVHISILALLVAALALYSTAITQKRANFQRRIETLSEVLRNIHSDGLISKAYYAIEYGEFVYDREAGFHGTEVERQVDMLLHSLNLVAKQYYIGLLKRSDLD